MASSGWSQAGLQQLKLTSAKETGKELGRGSYAAVVEVDYKGLRCAGKKIHKILFEGSVERLLGRFEEECLLLSRLRHPHIVQFLGVYVDSESRAPVLVMEFLPNTLTESLEKYGIMPEEIIHTILRDVALGLHFLHDRKDPIIHRDLSANNVLLTTDMRAKISDLGVAKILQVNPVKLSTMTKAPGTQCYMPPEALAPVPRYNVKVDIFSYGVLMVHILSGVWPSPEEAVKVDPDNEEKLIPVSEFDRRVKNIEVIKSDHALLPLIKRCLSNGPKSRPGSGEVLLAVNRAADDHTPSFNNRLELIEKVTSLEESNKSATDANKKLRTEIESLKSTNADLSNQLESFQTSSLHSSSLSTQLELIQGELSECTSQSERWQQLCKLKETQLSEAELSHREEVDLLRQRMSEMQTAVEEEHQSNLESTLRRHTAEKSALEREIERLKLENRDRRQPQSAEHLKQELERVEKKYQRQLEAKSAELALKEDFLAANSKTIESLREQLKTVGHTSTLGLAAGTKQVHLASPGSKLKFKECRNLPSPMFYITSTIIGDDLYAGGGFGGSRTADEKVEKSIYKYNLPTDTWSTPFPPTPVVKFGLANLAGKIVLIGGRPKPSRVVSDVYEFNEEGGEWVSPSHIPPMPTARSSLTTISWKTPASIIACGGFDKSFNPQTCVEIYDQKTVQWHRSYSLPFPRAIATHTIIGNTLYIVGGYKNNKPHGYTRSVAFISVNDLLKYQESSPAHSPTSPTSPTPKEAHPPWKELPEVPNYFTSATSQGGCLMVVGGQKESLGAMSCITSVYIYCPSSTQALSWQHVGDLPVACTMCATAVLPNGELLVMGGCTNNGLINRVFKGTVTLE